MMMMMMSTACWIIVVINHVLIVNIKINSISSFCIVFGKCSVQIWRRFLLSWQTVCGLRCSGNGYASLGYEFVTFRENVVQGEYPRVLRHCDARLKRLQSIIQWQSATSHSICNLSCTAAKTGHWQTFCGFSQSVHGNATTTRQLSARPFTSASVHWLSNCCIIDSIFFSMARQPLGGLGRLFSRLHDHTF